MRYDAIIIGAGQAGPGIAISLANKGQKVALIEGDKVGGTCLNYGCRPTKALRKSAEIAHQARIAGDYGVKTGAVSVDFAEVMGRKNQIIGGMQDGFADYIYNDVDNLDIYDVYGEFVGTQDDVHQVQAGDTLLESERVFINVGARAAIPPIDGIDDVPYITNVEILDLDTLPEHLIIVGGGYIGLEFGQMFRRFGSEVTIIEGAAHVASKEDEDVSEAIEKLLTDEAITLYTGHHATAAQKTKSGISVTIKDKATDAEAIINGSHLLIASGRTPNSDKLNLESVGVEMDDHGYITTSGKFETNVPGIWALGDVNGRGAFTHTSYQDYEILMENLEGGDRSVDGRIMAYAMFLDPPLGHVGMHEKEARESGRNVLISTMKMDSVSRAQLDNDTVGLIKVLVDADSEEILGATAFGMQGDDVVQIFSYFMHTGASYKIMRDALPVHPTVGEFVPTILGNLEPLE